MINLILLRIRGFPVVVEMLAEVKETIKQKLLSKAAKLKAYKKATKGELTTEYFRMIRRSFTEASAAKARHKQQVKYPLKRKWMNTGRVYGQKMNNTSTLG